MEKKLDLSYYSISDFIEKYNKISYIEFDYYVVHNINLFIYNEEIDFDNLKSDIELINKTMFAIKRIFQKPIIHLVESNDILPVEAVRIIDNQTLIHASQHSELWADVKKDNIRPNKLLTRMYLDNYSIYENIAFTKAIKTILTYVKNSLYILNEIVYSNDVLDINLLERQNHLNYFLALGKLHTGYVRNYAKYYDYAIEYIKQLNDINDTIKARLHKPIYKKNKKLTDNFKLHKTNILSMDKNYHKIFLLLKKFNSSGYLKINDTPDTNYETNYFYYCILITIFTLGYLNFTTEDIIDFKNIKLSFSYLNYNIAMKADNIRKTISLEFTNDKVYKIIISTNDIPSIYLNYDEKLYFNDDKNIIVSIKSIDSFRRIQQIILRGMIYSTKNFKTCPFCGEKMAKKDDGVLCSNCKTFIKLVKCNCGNTYYQTTIYNYHKRDVFSYTKFNSEMEKKKLLETQQAFRNITKLGYNSKCLCSKCKK